MGFELNWVEDQRTEVEEIIIIDCENIIIRGEELYDTI